MVSTSPELSGDQLPSLGSARPGSARWGLRWPAMPDGTGWPLSQERKRAQVCVLRGSWLQGGTYLMGQGPRQAAAGAWGGEWLARLQEGLGRLTGPEDEAQFCSQVNGNAFRFLKNP